ncbi:MAG TPA: glycosyltransferase family 9 protein [Gemmatimonadaceae bacterium]|jgi:ADP-heptose:LPS heptosyltransferase|nr:glycosyltransferase family 9 protein [Gemmatimonadaceae bacterium]
MRLKSVELWWRRRWIRLLVRLMRRSGGERPDWGARPYRVLFLRHDRAGDMVLSTGVMRAIARSHPTITMDVLASPANAAIIAGADYVHEIVVFDKRATARYPATLARLRRGRYDAVIDCMVTAPSVTTLLLILASGARYRVGIAGRGNDAAFNVTVPGETKAHAHMADLLAALARAFNVELSPSERRPSLTLTPAELSRAERAWGGEREENRETAPRVLINVSAGTAERTWPEDNYVAVMRHLRERAADVVLRVIGAPAERGRAAYVADNGGGQIVATPGIRDAFALVATADFLLTPDTSIAHAATAFKVPCVAMYVRGKAEQWALYDTIGESVEHSDNTLRTLPVDRVLRAVDAVWSSAAVSRSS